MKQDLRQECGRDQGSTHFVGPSAASLSPGIGDTSEILD